MTTSVSTVETAALITAIRTDPGDATATAALTDYYQDQSCTPLAATRRVNQIVREAQEAQEAQRLATARAVVTSDGAKGTRIRAALRSACGISTSRPDYIVVSGAQPPTLSGKEGYTTFRDGGRCANPGAARRAGYKVEYHRSTLTVTVGADWVCTRLGGRK